MGVFRAIQRWLSNTPPAVVPDQPTATSAEEVLSRLANIDYDVYDRANRSRPLESNEKPAATDKSRTR